jgi:hypothetical protein
MTVLGELQKTEQYGKHHGIAAPEKMDRLSRTETDEEHIALYT